MTELEKYTVLLALIDGLKKHGSWCGETHIQKSAYFLQEYSKVPIDVEFFLYKHGPYSFELSEELTAMTAEDFLALVPTPPYGPKHAEGSRSALLRAWFPRVYEKYLPQIDFVASKLGADNIHELERKATALHYHIKYPDISIEKKARKIHKIKPHVSLQEAADALNWVSQLEAK